MKAVKRAIILCWIMLVACFIIKLFGGNWFEIICTNKHFISIGRFIDKHIVIKYIIAFVIYIPQMFLFYITTSVMPKPTKNQSVWLILALILIWFSQFISMHLKFALEIIAFLVCPILLRIGEIKENSFKIVLKRTWWYGFVGCSLNFIFQVISLLTKNVGIKYVDESTLTALILMIDYYIMIVLYYLYVRLKKE